MIDLAPACQIFSLYDILIFGADIDVRVVLCFSVTNRDVQILDNTRPTNNVS